MQTINKNHTSSGMEQAVEDCLSCHSMCEQTLAHCLKQGGRHVEAERLQALMDCIAICQTSASFMMRGSEFHHQTCAVCSDVCERCAESCEKLPNDAQMRACAEACRKCADSCGAMSGTKI
jgi:hypothetical protein